MYLFRYIEYCQVFLRMFDTTAVTASKFNANIVKCGAKREEWQD